MTAREVADLLGVDIQWVQRQSRLGRIPHLKVGREYRYRRETIMRWIAEEEAA